MKLNLGYAHKDSAEIVLYVPGITDDEGRLSMPIGGTAAPLTLIVRSKKTDEMKAAIDRFQDAAAQWYQAHETPKKKQTELTIVDEDPDAYLTMIEEFVLAGVIGWKNAVAENEKGERVENPPYDAAALRDTFRNDKELLMQVFSAYGAKSAGKFMELTSGQKKK